MGDQQHIIGRMEVQVNASQPLLATQLQQQLGYRLHTADFIRQLSALLDGLVGETEYIEIPTIAISLECTDDKDFHEQLLSKLSIAIKEQLAKQQPENIILTNGSEYTTALRLFFLKYGIRAFYNGADMITALQEEIKALPNREQPELEQLLKTAGKEDLIVWTRLYYLLGVVGMKQFFLRTFSCNEATLKTLMEQEAAGTGKSMPYTTAARGNATSADTVTLVPNNLLPNAEQWPVFFQHMLLGNERPLFVPTVTGKENTDASLRTNAVNPTVTSAASPAAVAMSLAAQLQRGLQIENAGLVLLWMECGRLFRTLGYVVDRQFINETAQQRAILLLHYICYGNAATGGEEDWLLNKLLCDWPLHMPVDPELAPDDAAKQAAGEMLTAYMEAWRKDRKFSTAWFSTAFLQREGQLSRRNDGAWMLTVNTRTEDILINKVSMVKYAWMPQILYVQW